jgi:hypothetical protein
MKRFLVLMTFTVLGLGGWLATADALVLCMNNTSGNVSIAAQCKNGETAVPPATLAALGLQGPKGDTGATGATGGQGPQGIQGVPGATGAAGPTGPAGPSGPQGTPGISSATFAFSEGGQYGPDFVKVISKTLPQGNWVFIATAWVEAGPIGGSIGDSFCQLRDSSGNVLGEGDSTGISQTMTLNGGAAIPPGGAEISLWCGGRGDPALLMRAQMVAMQVGSFF